MKELKKREIRTTLCDICIREAEPGSAGEGQQDSRTITGTAIVFNKESEVLDENWDPFREIIKPEAVTAAFLKTQDIKLNLLHERNSTFARCNKGKGNLRVTVDREGVKFEVDAPKCDIGDRALELTRAGVYTGCSFEFVPKDYIIEEKKNADGSTYTLVTHTALESISALTIAMDPAYQQTAVSARELSERTPQAIERKKERARLREREAEAAAARVRMRTRLMLEY